MDGKVDPLEAAVHRNLQRKHRKIQPVKHPNIGQNA